MNIGIRFSGAVMILVGCTGIGFSAASLYRMKVRVIRNFLCLLDAMITELGSRVTPLPELCRIAAGVSGLFHETMRLFSESLEIQIAPNPVTCMEHAMARVKVPCREYSLCLQDLYGVLGCYDLTGQLRQLEGLHGKWSKTLELLENDLTTRVRYFRVFGVCAGCALAILLV